MWIIPNNLQLSSGAPDTAGFISDLNEQSQICASSLMVRSKPSRSQTWSQKWKRDSWTALLSGRILRPSHAKPFETEWTCLWPVIPANPSARQESGSEQKTLATSGRTSPDQYELFAPECVFSRTSKDTSPSDSERSLENWNQWVTKCRGEYSQRVKSARLTSASGSSSWPSPIASEYKDVGPVGSKSHDHMLGKGYLCAVVTQDAANWPTPCAMEAEKAGLFDKGQSLSAMANRGELSNWLTPATVQIQRTDMQKRIDYRASIGRKYVPGSLEEQMQQHGQVAPANPSTLGSRQELSEEAWPTPTAVNRVRNEETMEKCLKFRQSNGQTSVPLYLEEKVQQWATPQASDPEHSGPNQRSSSGRPALPAQAMQWATPRSGKTTDENPETWAKRQEKGDVATMPLTAQVKCWGTPTARDHKSGRGNEEREYKELTPMVERTQSGKLNPRWVETLMGLPVGWTMPSCARPVTIELTSCDSSATASCLPPQSEHSEF